MMPVTAYRLQIVRALRGFGKEVAGFWRRVIIRISDLHFALWEAWAALTSSTRSTPNLMNLVNNTDFIFNTPYQFKDRFSGADDFYKYKDDIEPDPVRGLATSTSWPQLVSDTGTRSLTGSKGRCL